MSKKNVLSLNNTEARKFFLAHSSYSNIELPSYFDFRKILFEVTKIMGAKVLSFDDLKEPKKFETINHILYGNKDGRYAWRKYELIHPLIYVSLVNIFTQKDNWKFLQNRFKEFQYDKNIECVSIPVLFEKGIRQKASQISHWVENVEKKSVVLSLDYKFLYQTDITDCYGSIYTHSIPWAIHGKEESKKKRHYDDVFGNMIDHHLQAVSCGQTNGIPQGSLLMDFIAEAVLGYIDTILSEKIRKLIKHDNFHILRYRDDYRVFVNNTFDGDLILKCISETLIDFGFKLNTGKTYSSNDVISGSIKADKVKSILIGDVPKNMSHTGAGKDLFNQLLIIQQLSKEFPNSGSLKTRLSKLLEVVTVKNFNYQQDIITSILIDIGYNNPNTFPTVASMVSVCISKMTLRLKKDILIKIKEKVCTLSNIGLIEIWIQRISIGLKFKLSLDEPLCKMVYGEKVLVFESSWITDKTLRDVIEKTDLVNRTKLNKTKPIIEKKEVQIFEPYF